MCVSACACVFGGPLGVFFSPGNLSLNRHNPFWVCSGMFWPGVGGSIGFGSNMAVVSDRWHPIAESPFTSGIETGSSGSQSCLASVECCAGLGPPGFLEECRRFGEGHNRPG